MSYTDTPASSNAYLIISVVLVCCLAVLFSSYKILLKFCSAFPSVRNWNQRRMLLNEANHDDPSLQFHSQGLDFSITRSLPVAQFKKKSEAEVSENSRSNTDCPVCLGEFEEGEWLRHLPKCSHAFHISCIDTWFVSHSNCPLCRSEVFDFMQDCPIPMHTQLETLRESVIQDRVLHYQTLRSTILAHSPLGRQTRINGDHNV